MSSNETKMSREQHDDVLNATTDSQARNNVAIREWRDKSVLANKVLEAKLHDWNAAFPIKSAIDVHKENCAAEQARKLALVEQGFPADHVRSTSNPQSVIDAVAMPGGNVNRNYTRAYARGAHPRQFQGRMIEKSKLPSDW